MFSAGSERFALPQNGLQYGFTCAGPIAPISDVTFLRKELSMKTTLASSSGDSPCRLDASRIQPENSVAVDRGIPSARWSRFAKPLTSSFQAAWVDIAAGTANAVRSTPRSPSSKTTALHATDAKTTIAAWAFHSTG